MSPSLACDTPLDFYLKSNLVAETLNLACIHLCDGNHDFGSAHDKDVPPSPGDGSKPLLASDRDLYLKLKVLPAPSL